MAGLQIFHFERNKKSKKTPKNSPGFNIACLSRLARQGGGLSLKSGLQLCFILILKEI
jgi:hypothetical protein